MYLYETAFFLNSVRFRSKITFIGLGAYCIKQWENSEKRQYLENLLFIAIIVNMKTRLIDTSFKNVT